MWKRLDLTVGALPDARRAVGKVVIVTGCNSPLGMGRATAHQFARNGALAVYICDYVDSYLGLHVEEMNELYPNVHVHARHFDAGNEDGVKEVVDHAIKTYGRLDVFFANAANSGTWKEVWNMKVDEFERTIRTNLTRYVGRDSISPQRIPEPYSAVACCQLTKETVSFWQSNMPVQPCK